MDLLGYGDDNHIRTALIDSVVQERYLDRSIRRLGARNTLLVTNKSDQLFDHIRKQINKLEEEPFPLLKERLAGIEAMAKQRTEDRSLVCAYRDYLLKKAMDAYIKREARVISSSLQDKGVDILCVSARQYSLCLEDGYAEEYDEKPKLTPEATGLPQLRRYLFHLPAQTNYRTLHYHVFETLPDIVLQVQRILEKFDDKGYAEMREYLAEQLPLIRKSIESLAQSLPVECMVRPFDGPGDKSRINTGLKGVVQGLAAPIVYYQSFSKMLKEHGMVEQAQDPVFKKESSP